ncbi:hypothetical protein ACFL6O_03340 [candidate division KSB1 bacterium]
MFFKRYRSRKFEYIPFKYDPEEDERISNRKRIEFRRMANTYKKGSSLPKLMILTIIIILGLYYIQKLA